jgi:hypothetical protein
VEHQNGVREIRASSDSSVATARAATVQLQGQLEGMMALLARVATPQVVHAPANFDGWVRVTDVLLLQAAQARAAGGHGPTS